MGKPSPQRPPSGILGDYGSRSKFGLAGLTIIFLWTILSLLNVTPSSTSSSPPTGWTTWPSNFFRHFRGARQPNPYNEGPPVAAGKRGTIALVYSGTARSFSANFESHIINLMAGCPYDIHLYFHTYKNDNRWPDGVVADEFANYRSVNATLDYFKGFVNLDNQQVLFSDAVKANILEDVPVEMMSSIYPEFDGLVEKYAHLPVPAYYYMWHSQRRGEEARQEYIKSTGIEYVWTMRMRHDATYFTNWWQKAFDVDVYDERNPLMKHLSHDVSADWGETATWLYDLVYTPRLSPFEAMFTPHGWSWNAVNDQYAAMNSDAAQHYFSRILDVPSMEAAPQYPKTFGRVHAETSVMWISRQYNLTVDIDRGSICYDVVRAIPSTEDENEDGSPVILCAYKTSGVQDCNRECRWHERVDEVLKKQFGSRTGRTRTEVLQDYLDRLIFENAKLGGGIFGLGSGIKLTASSSSFYYWRRYGPLGPPTPCHPSTWSPDQENNYKLARLPFAIGTKKPVEIAKYKALLTCGTID